MIAPVKVDKRNIVRRADGTLFLKRNEGLISDMKSMYDFDIAHDQAFLAKAMLSADGSVMCSMLPDRREITF